MIPLVIVGVVCGSFVLALVAVRISIWIAHRYKALDKPDSGRKLQSSPVPLLGGLAVALVFVCVTSVVTSLLLPLEWASILGVMLPALALAVLGYIDDVRKIDPQVRLLCQALCAALAWSLGTQLALTDVPWIDFLLFLFWVLLIVNGLNLIDNADGLAASTTLVAASGAGVIALLSGQELVVLLAAALVGVAAGFLWHNWYPARVYLGDAGAYFLGFLLAVLVVRLRPQEMPPLAALSSAALLLLLPICDTCFVVIRRLVRGVHPFTAGRDHLSHEIQRRSGSVPVSVLSLQLVSILGAVTAIALVVALG